MRAAMARLVFEYGPRPAAGDSFSVDVLAGGEGVPGFDNGLRHDASFKGPAGAVQLPNGDLLVADRDNAAIRTVRVDGTVGTLLGRNGRGFNDGNFHKAMLRSPQGLCLCKDLVLPRVVIVQELVEKLLLLLLQVLEHRRLLIQAFDIDQAQFPRDSLGR